MATSMKIVSWNIAGGHTIKSNKRFDYDEHENAEYFIDHLKAIDADVVCLQESHWHPEKSLSNRIATALNLGFVFETVNSPSGIDPQFKESTAILSKNIIEDKAALKLPYPDFELFLPDGTPAAQWDKFLQVCRINGIVVGNIHTQPMGYFGFDYHEGQGVEYAAELEKCLTDNMRSPFVLAGDFNTTMAENVFTNFYHDNNLLDALPSSQPTRPSGKHIDYILHTPTFSVKQSDIVETSTDHFLCWTELVEDTI